MSDIAIKVEGLGKRFSIGANKSVDLKESLSAKLRALFHSSHNLQSEFWALNDISVEVNRGEALGIIGRNGAGKSTLLKILSRITEPSRGRFEINGRVSSLLEVGTGFHQELTGRENVYLNGTILGMRRQEVKARFDEIVAFSGVEKFIDTPVKHYSSGMKVRLAFSVAAHLEPEILIVDEVLAVGDAEFQSKCLGKMGEVSKEGGRTVLFVSHNMAAIQSLCSKVLVLNAGQVTFNGQVNEGLSYYLNSISQKVQQSLRERNDRSGTGKVKLTSFRVEDLNGNQMHSVPSGADIQLCISYESEEALTNAFFRLQVVNRNGHVLFTCNNYQTQGLYKNLPAKGRACCIIRHLPLFEGNYTVNLQCVIGMDIADDVEGAAEIIVEKGDFFGTGKIPMAKEGVLMPHTWSVE